MDPLEVDVQLLKGGKLGLVPVLLDGHDVSQGLHFHQVVGNVYMAI